MYNLPLQYANIGYGQNSKDVALAPPSNKQLHLYACTVKNESGGPIDMAILKRMGAFSLYTLTAASTPDAVAATAPITTFAANNDGFLVQSQFKFGMIGFAITTGQAGGTFAIQYYNGTSYTTLTTFVAPANYGSTGQFQYIFNAPVDWAKGTTAAIGGDTGMYSIRVISSTAAAGGVVIDSIFIAELLKYQVAVADHGELSINPALALQPIMFSGAEGVQPYFGGTATAKNSLQATYAIQG